MRPVFQHEPDAIYVSIYRWLGGGGSNRRIEAYLAKDGSEIVRRDDDR